jgi:hypothetical protein
MGEPFRLPSTTERNREFEWEDMMGDKSPKSKERGQKQKDVARVTGAAKAASKQASHSHVLKNLK